MIYIGQYFENHGSDRIQIYMPLQQSLHLAWHGIGNFRDLAETSLHFRENKRSSEY